MPVNLVEKCGSSYGLLVLDCELDFGYRVAKTVNISEKNVVELGLILCPIEGS